jgi:squalene-hopene/tetraprenyl-beta-curcumene cyclase
MKRATVLAMIVVAGFTGVSAQKAAGPAASRSSTQGWDPAAAATYLDDRMDLWFVNANKLRTGNEKTSCVSCHSSVGYALARPALRRTMHVGGPTAAETRLVEEVTRRVESYGSHQLLYEINDVKKVESRGTEAVLNTVVLASSDRAAGRPEPSAATRKALDHLWEVQRPDGAWDWLNFKLEPYETVDAVYHGATLAALGVGMVPVTASNGSASVGAGRLRAYLRENLAVQSVYNRTFTLLAAASLPDLLTRAQRDDLVAELIRRQRQDGGWSLMEMGPWRWSAIEPPFKPDGTLDQALLGQSDGFATGLIVYTLLRNGRRASDPAVSTGLRWLKAHQQEIHVDDRTWTAWRAYSLNYDREHGGPKGEPWRRLFMSDAATAFSALALIAAESDQPDHRHDR